jgi:uncharacterized sulfatase
MSKRFIINTLIILLLIVVANACGSKSKQPNILFFITDDQSWVHTSFAGEKAITTPAFDRVASEGLYFKNAFCAAPSCSPSRGAIITGQEIWRLGEAAQLYSAVPKKLERVSFPLLLQENGYYIGHTLKGWSPNNFKIYNWEENPLGRAFNSRKLQAPASKIVSNDYAGNFEDFINSAPEDKPFFFWFGASEPHRAFEKGSGAKNGVDPENVKVPAFLPDVPEVRSDIADYLFEIKWVDKHHEKMIGMLEERGLLENTIIIATSDNGMAFPGAKNNLYEYGIHMPLAIMWRNGIKKSGRSIDDLVSLTDIAPTLLECSGTKIPEVMTGKSLVNIFNSKSTGRVDINRKYVFAGKERHTVCRENDLPYPQRCIRDNQFLYIRNNEPGRWPAGSPYEKSVHGWLYGDIDLSPTLSYILEHKEEKGVKELFGFAMAKRPYEELYDIIKDPSCLNNLASEKSYTKAKKRLEEALNKYLLETGDPRAYGDEAHWDKYPYYYKNPEGIAPYKNIANKLSRR